MIDVAAVFFDDTGSNARCLERALHTTSQGEQAKLFQLIFYTGGTRRFVTLLARMKFQQAFVKQKFVDVEHARRALEAMIGDHEEAVVRAELFEDSAKPVIEQAVILSSASIKRDDFFPQRMLQAVSADKG